MAQLYEIEKLHSDDPKAQQWYATTQGIMHAAFGKPDGENHRITADFLRFTGPLVMGMDAHAYQQSYRETLQHQRAVLKSSLEQLELLTPASEATLAEPIPEEAAVALRALDTVLLTCDRFHQVASQLTQRRQGRPTLEIHDEYDVQNLLHAILRLHFDDIRPEEWTPSYAGGAARMDFLLKRKPSSLRPK